MTYGEKLFVGAALLNIHGLSALLIGTPAPVTAVLFILASMQLWRHWRSAASPYAFRMVVLVMLYLTLGAFYYRMPHGRVDGPMRYFVTYSGTLLVFLAAFAISVAEAERCGPGLRFVRNCLLASGASVLLSPALYSIAISPPISYVDGRWGGVFSNPNEAGMVCLYGILANLTWPYGARVAKALAHLTLSSAIVMTFSKSATLAALAIYLVYGVRSLVRRKSPILWGVAGLVVLLVVNVGAVTQFRWDDMAGLTRSQVARISDVVAVLQASTERDVTTGRTGQWQQGLDQIVGVFPHGGGLGTFHYLEGSEYQNGVLLGVHSTFLMIAGESGPIPLAVLVSLFAGMAVAVLRRGRLDGICLFGLVLLECSATHTALEQRYTNVMLALLMAGCAPTKVGSLVPQGAA